MTTKLLGCVMAGTKKICSRCILDTTVPEIKFDENGVCNYCKLHDRLEEKYTLNEEGQRKLNGLVEEIKSDGKGKKYDCIVGVSGGTDSTYTLYVVKKMVLRPLAVHLDNGWNSEIAVRNIKNAVAKLGVDLHTIVLDWEEFKDIQLSFLKASVPDAEIPTDIAILGALFKAAADEKIRYVINGHSFRTEGNSPIGWSYMDGRYVKSVQKIFGSKKLKTFTNVTIFDLLYYLILKRVRFV